MTNADYTAAALKGIPCFCVDRVYTKTDISQLGISYRFRFPNGFGASVIEYDNKSNLGGEKYELAVIEYSGICNAAGRRITYDIPVTCDVLCGDAKYINSLLIDIEALKESAE